MFWGCPLIKSNWLEILIRSMLSLSFELFYLVKITVEITGYVKKYMIRAMLILSINTITQKWLQRKVNDWVEVIQRIHTMGKLTYSLR